MTTNQTQFVYDHDFQEKYKYLGCTYPECECGISSGWNGVIGVCPLERPKRRAALPRS